MLSDKPAISIRRATPADAPGILDCLREAFAEYREAYTPAAFRDTVVTPEVLQNRLVTMCVLVAASVSGEIAGTVACNVLGLGEGHVRGMAVRPLWHGADVADKLIQAVESELRSLGCTRLTLDTTLPLQRAARFYEKHGFGRSGRTADFFGMELVEYVKDLRK
jgi:N-acetylglutamate synthase-like GNAT family acetyltransferase